MKLTEIHIEGYRSLIDVTLPLRNLMVLIGPNGSGKTALLEVFVLLKYAAQERLSQQVEALGGAQAILSRTLDSPDCFKLALAVDVESPKSSELMHYRFELAPRATGFALPFERLEWKWDIWADKPFRYIDAHHGQVYYSNPTAAGSMERPTWEYNALELALAQAPRLYTEPEALRGLLAGIELYSWLDVTQRAIVRLPQSLTPTRRPGPNGENLYSALYNLRAMESDTYSRIEELLRLGFPGFQRLEFPVVGAGQVTLAWYQKGIVGPFYPNQLSEGTLRFLWLITILLSPDAPTITLLDEPEVSLHPELLKLLAGVLQDASMRMQILAATHSPDLIGWLQPDQVLVADKNEEGATTFTWADRLNLQAWLEEYTLRDLWLMGTLGGRP